MEPKVCSFCFPECASIPVFAGILKPSFQAVDVGIILSRRCGELWWSMRKLSARALTGVETIILMLNSPSTYWHRLSQQAKQHLIKPVSYCCLYSRKPLSLLMFKAQKQILQNGVTSKHQILPEICHGVYLVKLLQIMVDHWLSVEATVSNF